MKFQNPTNTILYSIEESIKAYRKLCHNNITKVIPDITVDQALILIIINNNSHSQSEIAEAIFKDYASMTRILNLMITKEFITKSIDENDRRKTIIQITPKGRIAIKKLKPIITKNRNIALNNISIEKQVALFNTLNSITKNCKLEKQ